MKKPSILCAHTKCYRLASRFSTVCRRHQDSDGGGAFEHDRHLHAGTPVVPTPIVPQQSST